MHEFMNANGPAVVDELIRRDLPSSALPDDDEVRAWMHSMVPQAIDTLFGRFHDVDRGINESLLSAHHSMPISHDSGYYTANHDMESIEDHGLPSTIFDAETIMNGPRALSEEASNTEQVLHPGPSFDYNDFMSNMIDMDDFPDFSDT